MLVLSRKSHESVVVGGADGIHRMLKVTVPADTFQVVGAGQDNTDLSRTALVSFIRERLEQHPHFRGRSSLFQIELVEETIVLSGRLRSHYLKQLLQEAIREIPGVLDIDNQVIVTRPNE